MRLVLAPFLWLGRVLLWIVCFPLGLWRSIRHGRKKRDRKLVENLRAVTREEHDQLHGRRT